MVNRSIGSQTHSPASRVAGFGLAGGARGSIVDPAHRVAAGCSARRRARRLRSRDLGSRASVRRRRHVPSCCRASKISWMSASRAASRSIDGDSDARRMRELVHGLRVALEREIDVDGLAGLRRGRVEQRLGREVDDSAAALRPLASVSAAIVASNASSASRASGCGSGACDAGRMRGPTSETCGRCQG